MSAGIDYGLGLTNIDHTTGIRYGCISMHSVTQAWCDSSEPEYGEPACPKCGNPVELFDAQQHGHYEHASLSIDHACEFCEIAWYADDTYGEEPIGYTLDDGEYLAQDCLDSDILILKSPYYTYAPFCSPCVPGAGNLEDAVWTAEQGWPGSIPGIKAYCFSHDWFESGKAPYRVFRVSDDTEVTV